MKQKKYFWVSIALESWKNGGVFTIRKAYNLLSESPKSISRFKNFKHRDFPNITKFGLMLSFDPRIEKIKSGWYKRINGG